MGRHIFTDGAANTKNAGMRVGVIAELCGAGNNRHALNAVSLLIKRREHFKT